MASRLRSSERICAKFFCLSVPLAPINHKSVCRDKPRISSGGDKRKTHPGTNAPPGTTSRGDGGDKINQAHQEKGRE